MAGSYLLSLYLIMKIIKVDKDIGKNIRGDYVVNYTEKQGKQEVKMNDKLPTIEEAKERQAKLTKKILR